MSGCVDGKGVTEGQRIAEVAVRAAHLTSVGLLPGVLTRRGVRQSWLYYDCPTVLLGAVRVLASRSCRTAWGRRRGRVLPVVAGVAGGILLHTSSWVVMKKKLPRYGYSAPDLWLVPTTIAEEMIWRSVDRRGVLWLVADGALFGVLHLPVGGWMAAKHMTVFGFLAGVCARRWGLMASIGLHVGYNLAQNAASAPVGVSGVSRTNASGSPVSGQDEAVVEGEVYGGVQGAGDV